MSIAFFFQYENLIVQLPVNPAELKVTYPGANQTKEIVKLGQVNVLKTPQLSEMNIDCFFPKYSNLPGVLTKGKFKQAKFYIDFFNKIMNDAKPCRLVISDTGINMLVSIEKFEQQLKGGDDDTYYTVSVKSYKPFSSKVLKIATTTTTKTTTPTTGTKPTTTSSKIVIGSTVIVNGRLHRDSYGSGPGQTRTNYTGKVNLINMKGSHPYHVTNPEGGYLGWVLASAVKLK